MTRFLQVRGVIPNSIGNMYTHRDRSHLRLEMNSMDKAVEIYGIGHMSNMVQPIYMDYLIRTIDDPELGYNAIDQAMTLVTAVEDNVNWFLDLCIAPPTIGYYLCAKPVILGGYRFSGEKRAWVVPEFNCQPGDIVACDEAIQTVELDSHVFNLRLIPIPRIDHLK